MGNNIRMTFSDTEISKHLFGEQNSNLKKIAKAAEVSIHNRGNTLFIQGETESVKFSQNILNQLYGLLKENYPVYPNDIDHAVKVLSQDD